MTHKISFFISVKFLQTFDKFIFSLHLIQEKFEYIFKVLFISKLSSTEENVLLKLLTFLQFLYLILLSTISLLDAICKLLFNSRSCSLSIIDDTILQMKKVGVIFNMINFWYNFNIISFWEFLCNVSNIKFNIFIS